MVGDNAGVKSRATYCGEPDASNGKRRKSHGKSHGVAWDPMGRLTAILWDIPYGVSWARVLSMESPTRNNKPHWAPHGKSHKRLDVPHGKHDAFHVTFLGKLYGCPIAPMTVLYEVPWDHVSLICPWEVPSNPRGSFIACYANSHGIHNASRGESHEKHD